MNFKVALLIVAVVMVLAISGFTFYYLHQAAAESAVVRQVQQAEAECAGQVQRAAQLVTEKDDQNGESTRVTGSVYHYNHLVQSCFVEVSTYQHGAPSLTGKTLISIAQNTAVLWSVTQETSAPVRRCFGPDAMPLVCDEADKRWKTFMSE
jgi:hypothetical protein